MRTPCSRVQRQQRQFRAFHSMRLRVETDPKSLCRQQMSMKVESLRTNTIVRGPIFPEPVQVIVSIPMGATVKLVGKGWNSGKVYEPILTEDKLALLEATTDTEPFDGDPKTAIDVRFIEVKGRAEAGEIALTTNEYNTAKRLKKDYYLYVVTLCATAPGPGHVGLAASGQSRAVPPQAGFHQPPGRAKGRPGSL